MKWEQDPVTGTTAPGGTVTPDWCLIWVCTSKGCSDYGCGIYWG